MKTGSYAERVRSLIHTQQLESAVAGNEINEENEIIPPLPVSPSVPFDPLATPVADFVPLDQAIIRNMASRTTMEQIQERLDHSRLVAVTSNASPLWAQVVRDWESIAGEKATPLRAVGRSACCGGC